MTAALLASWSAARRLCRLDGLDGPDGPVAAAPAPAAPPISQAPAAPPMSPAPARTAWSAAGFSLALLLAFAVAGAVDDRTLAGDGVWLKPAKFALSFAVLWATLALVVERLSPAARDRRALRATLAAMTVATWGEMACIGGRAAFGRASHFAVSTPLEVAVYTAMGVGAVTLVVGIAIVGRIAGRDGGAAFGPATRAGVAIGLPLSAALTLVVAGYLSSRGGHFVGVPAPGAAVIPGFGWSAAVGDLRPAHFVALHAMQLLPLAGAWLDRRGVTGAAGRRAVAALAVAYALLTLALFAQALAGQPLLRL